MSDTHLLALLRHPLAMSLQERYLDPPRASYLHQDSNSNSQAGSPTNSTTVLAKSESDESAETYPRPTAKRRRGPLFWGACLLVLVVVVLAVILPVYFTVIKKNNDDSSTSSSSTSDTTPSGNGNSTDEGTVPSTSGAITGSNGSEVTTEDGTQFTYNNKFGGFWVSDPADPFGGGAKPNSWTPALNETWTPGKDRIFG